MTSKEILEQHIKDDSLSKCKEAIKEQLLIPLQECKELNKTIQLEYNTNRNPYERDYTRVLYSPSFRRLQGKMQLLAVKNDKFFRNRLTHSLEVAQIAKSIAREIGYETYELDVVEAGALAHDLGNPPFGHYGEEILNDLSKDIGGYEGNAQTLRILTTLEKKSGHFSGLNLTNRTILSILKYNKKYSDCNKAKPKFIYDKDFELIDKIKNDTHVKLRTLDVQIVDVSDEIAYAAHDLEDGLSQGLFTIDEVVFAFESTYKSDTDENRRICNFLKAIIEESKSWATNAATSPVEYSSMFNNKLSSLITYHLIRDLGLVALSPEDKDKKGSERDDELYFSSLSKLAQGLKEITFSCVSNTDEVFNYEQAGKKIITCLYSLYLRAPKYLPSEYRVDESEIKDLINLPKEIKEKTKANATIESIQLLENKLKEIETKHRRYIIDFISGMMDSYAVTQYEKFFGEKALAGFYESMLYDSNEFFHFDTIVRG
jgi:dGTPase